MGQGQTGQSQMGQGQTGKGQMGQTQVEGPIPIKGGAPIHIHTLTNKSWMLSQGAT